MKVKELIKELEGLNQEANVFLHIRAQDPGISLEWTYEEAFEDIPTVEVHLYAIE